MKIRLLCVGKPKEAALSTLHDRYAQRITQLGVRFRSDWVNEVQSGGRFSDEHIRERESQSLLAALDDRGATVALDLRGDLLSSEELAKRLERWATPQATFAIGGHLGHHDSFLNKADRCWSLSPLTFPHELARVLVVEQIYRALGILRGSPYHK